MLHTAERINGRILWGNMHLLFWLSLIPFATGWMGENHFAALPTALYGCLLFLAACAYTILQALIIREHGPGSKLKRAVGKDAKGKLSAALYLVAIAFTFVSPWISWAIYVFVALLWLAPDRRIEAMLKS
jgi:TMEM175 potassium channel family protein